MENIIHEFLLDFAKQRIKEMDEMLFENKAIRPGYQVVTKNDIRTMVDRGLDDVSRLRVHLLNGGEIKPSEFDFLIETDIPIENLVEIRQNKRQESKQSLSFLLLLPPFFKGVSGILCIDSSIYNRRWLQVLTLYRLWLPKPTIN